MRLIKDEKDKFITKIFNKGIILVGNLHSNDKSAKVAKFLATSCKVFLSLKILQKVISEVRAH